MRTNEPDGVPDDPLKAAIREVMQQWGGSMSDLLDEKGFEEWVNDLKEAVNKWLEQQTRP